MTCWPGAVWTTARARSPSQEIELESVALPRDAFFGATENVAADTAAGRITAKQITPYPPGIPVVVPDPADTTLETYRVVA